MSMDTNTTTVLTLLIAGAGTAFSAYVALAQAKLATKVSSVVGKVDTVAADVLRVEKATNSHTDLLVQATRLASHAAGKDEGRLEQREAQISAKEGEIPTVPLDMPPPVQPVVSPIVAPPPEGLGSSPHD